MRVVKMRLETSCDSEDIELLSMAYKEAVLQGGIFDVAIISSPGICYQSLLHSLSLDSKTVVVNTGLTPLSGGELAILLAATLFKYEGSLELFNLNLSEIEAVDKVTLSNFYRLKYLLLGIFDNKTEIEFLSKTAYCNHAVTLIDGGNGALSACISKYLKTLARIYKVEHFYTTQINYEGIDSIKSNGFFSLSLEVGNILKSLDGSESFFNALLERKKFFELGKDAYTRHNRDKTNVDLALEFTAWASVLFFKLSCLHRKGDNYQLALAFLFRHLEEYLKTFLSAYSNVEYDFYGNFLINGKKASGVGSYMKEIETFSELNLKKGVSVFDLVTSAINYRNDFVLGHAYKLSSLSIFDKHFQNIKNFITALEAEIPEKYYTLNRNNKTIIGKLDVSKNFDQIIKKVYP